MLPGNACYQTHVTCNACYLGTLNCSGNFELLQRMRHFTQGVIFGSREFINEWFERNRTFFKGTSRENRQTGARPIGKQWRGLYSLRQLRT
jgi:hypothetical protein